MISIQNTARSSWTLVACCVCLLLTVPVTTAYGDEVQLTAEQTKFFETKIRPVLVKECYSCHSQTGMDKAGLFVDTRQGLLVGGESGPAIVPGDLDGSLLWSAINYEDFAMPPRNPLTVDEIADFRTWILMGAPDPRVGDNAEYKGTVTADDIARGKEFWSFVKPETPAIPKPMNEAWPVTDIDRFIAAAQEDEGLEPNPDADAMTILRRLCFDLNGLPPSPEQISWFEKTWNKDPERAIAHVVDALLDKPQFGERWGRHWLDVARFAESAGKEFNATFPHAWRYRDYVIDSFNEDKPYDRFLQEQIAGDLLPVKTDEQWQKNLIATGFLAVGSKTLVEQNRLKFRMDLIDEQIDVTTRTVMGVSVACARCHDHKFDPIPQADYYALAGIFMNTETYYGSVESQQNRNESGLIELPVSDPFDATATISQKELAELREQLAEKEVEYREAQRQRLMALRGTAKTSDSTDGKNQQRLVQNFARLGNQVAMLRQKIKSVDERGRPLSFCMGVQPADTNRDARLLIDGEVDQPGQTVPRGFVQVLSDAATDIPQNSSGRLELARWLTSRDHPLTARVMVNRIWQHLLGEGIVRSPEDFAITGEKPSHPELLDHLAVRFMNSDWSVKTIIREIATSRVYRASSAYRDEAFQQDPDNKLLWRGHPRRLEAEALRDAMLAVSGKIDLERPRASLVATAGPLRYDGQGGQFLQQIAMTADRMRQQAGNQPTRRRPGRTGNADQDAQREIMRQAIMSGNRDRVMKRLMEAAKERGQEGRLKLNEVTVNATQTHRSIYLPMLRDGLPRSLELFDMPEPSMIVGKRESSDTATQALYMMNNPFVVEQSEAMARRVLGERRGLSKQIQLAILLAYGREATKEELEISTKFFNTAESTERNQQLKSMSQFCQALFASAEFRYLN